MADEVKDLADIKAKYIAHAAKKHRVKFAYEQCKTLDETTDQLRRLAQQFQTQGHWVPSGALDDMLAAISHLEVVSASIMSQALGVDYPLTAEHHLQKTTEDFDNLLKHGRQR